MTDTASVAQPHPLILPIKMIWLAIAMIAVFDWGFGWLSQHYRILHDNQEIRCIEEYTTYFVTLEPDVQIERGKIYAFTSHNLEPWFDNGTTLGKYATAIAGDEVTINEQGVFVNGELAVTGFASAERAGIVPDRLYRTFTLAENEIFFTGTAERSFDSRYWGVAYRHQIIGEAIPLW